MVKYNHKQFPSDVCTLLEAANALVKVYDAKLDSYSTHAIYGTDGIMEMNMDRKVRLVVLSSSRRKIFTIIHTATSV